MSALMMFRRCKHCGHWYMYNPSAGNFCMICPKCNKIQYSVVDLPKTTLEDVLKNRLKDWTVKTVDAFFIHSQVPKVGSVLYCNLALAFEHTGIYVGKGKVVHLNGEGAIEKVSLKKFLNRLDGNNPSYSIFCATNDDGKSIGNREVAERALEMVGKHQEYNLFYGNCHCFTHYCLSGIKANFGSFSRVEELLRSDFGLANWRAIDMS